MALGQNLEMSLYYGFVDADFGTEAQVNCIDAERNRFMQ